VQVEGSMAQGAEVAPVVQVYSQDEYQRQEAVNKRARQAELRQNLKQLRSQISSGNLRMPNADFNQFKQNYQTVDADSAKELKAIETDLRKAQGSNLIRAQKAYTVENIAKINAQPLVQAEAQGQQAQQVAAMVQYDNEIAEQQWAQLEKAQQVTVAKVQPLRVNLPKRGLRYTFTQVLQTEVKKPMTIRLTAANVKDVSWTKRLLLSVGGFLVLWIALAFLPFRRPTPR
jgi:hypothetical protein